MFSEKFNKLGMLSGKTYSKSKSAICNSVLKLEFALLEYYHI